MYLEQRVKVYGNIESVFYFVESKLKRQRICKTPITEARYNPPTWIIALNKDLSFSKDGTYMVRDDNDISLLQNLVEKHFIVTDTTP